MERNGKSRLDGEFYDTDIKLDVNGWSLFNFVCLKSLSAIKRIEVLSFTFIISSQAWSTRIEI